MWIKSVRIVAFGPFKDASLKLTPGMNVVIGDNESGKTSWHAAIYAALCGIRRGAGIRSEDREFRNRHRPWEGDSWAVEAELHLADGREIEIKQELDQRVDCRAVDVGLGRTDVSHEIMFEGSPDASQWLGLDRRTFLATACVNQAEISFVTHSASALQDHLQRAAATAGADETAARALATLKEYRSQNVGLDRPNAVKPLRRAIVAAMQATQRLEAARHQHEKYLAHLETVERLEAEAAAARRRLDIVAAAAAAREAAIANRKVEQARSLAAELEGEHIDLETTQKAADRVTSALAAWRSAPEPRPLSGPTAEELDREFANLPQPPTGELAPLPQLVEAETAWRAARSALEAHASGRPPLPSAPPTSLSPAELRELARDLSTSVPAIDPALERAHDDMERHLAQLPERKVSVPLLAAAGLCAVASVAIGLYTSPLVLIAGLLIGAVLVALGVRNALRDPGGPLLPRLHDLDSRLAQSRLAVEAAQRTVAAAQDRTFGASLTADPTRLLALAHETEVAAAAAEKHRQWESSQSELERGVEDKAAVLRAALIASGNADPQDLDRAVAEYRGACTARARIAEQASRRPQLERELGTRRQAETAFQVALKLHQAAETGLNDVAREQGLEPGEPTTTHAALTTWQESNAERLSAAKRQAEARGELDALLSGGTLDDLVTAGNDALRRADAAARELARQEIDTLVGVANLEDLLADARKVAQSAHLATAGAQGQLKELSEAPASVAVAEEELDEAHRELQRVRRLDRTLEITYAILERAQERVHRDIAPVLERTLCEWLPRVTAARYADASVNPQFLSVKVKDPVGEFRDAELLSQGTLEQIYLLLRMALVEHLTRKGETSPLIFDDVTVQTDSARTVAILNLLHDIGKERQVIVFSQEEDVRRWAEANLNQEGGGLVRLGPPSADLQAPLPD